tara:strand:- start:56 stop:250 length:195 start_codon:yes stop_codon:yes gene_type:complete
MDKEPITVSGLEKLKEELIFLKEKNALKLLLQLPKLDHMEILKKMQSIMPLKNSNLIMKEEFKK